MRGLKDHLEFLAQNTQPLTGAKSGTALPHAMADALLKALKQTDHGEQADLFTPKASTLGRGNKRSLAKQFCVDWAVQYLTAVRLGWVLDTGALASVAKRFEVSKRQVERWVAASGTPAQREARLREWANRIGFQRFYEENTENLAGRALKRILPSMGDQFRRDRALQMKRSKR